MKAFSTKNLSSNPVLKCRDFTVSGETFELRKHRHLEMLVTSPAPSESKLPGYYKSESYISHTDSKRTYIDKMYQLVKKYMLDRKLNWLEKEQNSGSRILDIGAGTGDFLSAAKSRGWNISGSEPNFNARELASKKGVHLNENTEGQAPGAFDVITMWHVLEHVPDLDKQIKELFRLLKKGGLLVIAVPNYKSYDAKVYKEYWAAYDVPRHLWHFSGNAISQVFSEYGFQMEKAKPLIFDSFYVSLLSEKNIAGNPIKALLIGFLSNLKARRSKEYSSVVYFLRKTS